MKSTILLFVCFASFAYSWGSISHLYFMCENESNVDLCMNSLSSQHVFWGGLLPDGLNMDPFMEANNCSWAPHTHDPIFAGYMLLQAIRTGDQDLIQFANGYGGHIISDFVGFYVDPTDPKIHGYMTNKIPVDWTLQWIFMSAVDAFLYHNLSLQSPPLTNMSSKVANFFSESTYSYHAHNPQYPALTAETITACGQSWLALVQTMTARSAFLNSNNYNQDLIFFDQYGATTIETALRNFETSNYCSFKFVASWIAAVESDNDPIKAFNLIKSQVYDSFKSGGCSP